KGINENLGAGMSQEETLLLLNAGYDVNAIAEAKGIKPQTVYSHLSELINNDKLSDFSSIITREQYLRVMDVAKKHPDDFYVLLADEMPVGLPRVAVAISDFLLRKKGNS
ncbi:helix-turn-helix domain-containing protein, partial [uncultured Duncaniella sp.]